MVVALVIRHAHAAGNADHRFIGQQDVPLDDLGRAQTDALTQRLKALPITRIVSSDLQRALDTIAPTAARFGLTVETDARLREINNGEWTGRLPAEIAAGWPDLWTAYVAGADVRRPGGETWADVRQRAIKAIEKYAGDDGLIILCTHGGPSLTLTTWAAGLPSGGNVFRGPMAAIANTAVTTIELPGPRLIGFNDVGHLDRFVPDPRMPFDLPPPDERSA